MSATLPYGWEFIPANTKPCPHCGGRGEVEKPAQMIAPSGFKREMIGHWTLKMAKEYAEIWAPEKLTPEYRRKLYGPEPQSLDEAYRIADQTGRPVMFEGQKISPDYRPGHTTNPGG